MNLVPLKWATQALATLMTQIEASDEDLDEALILAFKDQQMDLREQVTCRQTLAGQLRVTIKGAKEYRDQVVDYIRRLERLESRMKEDALEAIKSLPDVELRGASGKKLYISRRERLKLDFDLKEQKSFHNLVDIEALEMFGIEPKYYKMITAYQLDCAAIKTDLKAGAQLPWASLEENEFVGGLFPPEKETKGE